MRRVDRGLIEEKTSSSEAARVGPSTVVRKLSRSDELRGVEVQILVHRQLLDEKELLFATCSDGSLLAWRLDAAAAAPLWKVGAAHEEEKSLKALLALEASADEASSAETVHFLALRAGGEAAVFQLALGELLARAATAPAGASSEESEVFSQPSQKRLLKGPDGGAGDDDGEDEESPSARSETSSLNDETEALRFLTSGADLSANGSVSCRKHFLRRG